MKKGLWLVLKVAVFLAISIIVVLPYLVQVSTFFHERGHITALQKYGVETSYSLNLLETIPNFFNPRVTKLGITQFNLDQYNQLNKYQRAEINLGGVVSDLRFLFLIGVYLSFVNIYTFYKIRFRKNYNLTWILAVNWILFMWLLALIQITVSNITYSSGDIYYLINMLHL